MSAHNRQRQRYQIIRINGLWSGVSLVVDVRGNEQSTAIAAGLESAVAWEVPYSVDHHLDVAEAWTPMNVVMVGARASL